MRSARESTYSAACHDVARVVAFCPFEWAAGLLAVGTASRVSVALCKFQNEEVDVEGLEYEKLRDFHHGVQVTALAWSPQTSLAVIPRLVKFCTAGLDKQLRLFTSDLKNEDVVKVMEGHTDFINCVTFDPDKGDHIASTADDHTCRVWGVDGAQRACFPLGSPGMTVAWHDQEPMKIMVAEKGGIIRFYNLLTQQPIMSLDSGKSPLMAADWCIGNPLKVAAIVGPDWLLFDTSRSSRPISSKSSHPEGGCRLQWSRSHSQLLATMGRPGSEVKVFNTRTNQTVLIASLPISDSLSWHLRLPILAVGGDEKVHFWVVDPV